MSVQSFKFVTIFLFVLPEVVLSVPFASKNRLDSGPNADPISTTPPNFPGGEVVVDAFPGPFFQDFTAPLPTDSWWVGLGVGNQDAVLAGPFPFQTVGRNTGLEFGVSRDRRFDGTSIIQGTQLDWSIGFDGLPEILNNRKTTGWDTQTVCLQYFDGARTMDTCLVPGSPYMTFAFANAVVRLTSLKGDISSFDWVEQGKKLRITSTEGGTYVLYVLSGNLDLVQNGLSLTSSSEFSGTIRMAKIYDGNDQEAVLDSHKDSVPTGVNFEYQVTGDESTMTWTWQVDGDANNLLMLCWPHHRKVLVAPNYINIQYMTIKGFMKGVLGNQWILKHSLPTVTWFPPNSPHPSCLAELEKTLESDVDDLQVREPGDFYFWGGAFARDATLATIAEHIGREDLRERAINVVKQSMAYFFDPAHFPRAAYERLWGGMVNDRDLNYTKAYYNDHHFLYGYWLHGAAIIARSDPNWLNEHLDFFNHMSRDIGNPSPKDPHYTVTRHMDWFAGHSWASGIANGAGPRDQESSGEAINGYYGLLLWADVTNNAVLRDYARMLLAIELAGARDYWHLYPKVNDPDSPYPEQAFRDLVTVGNVMDTQAGAWLFWGGQRIQVAAIQILPLTPLMAYNYDKPWLEEVYPYCRGELEDITIGGAFKSVIYAAYAGVNSDVAYAGSKDLIDWGSGNSATNQLYFVATHASKTDGDVCPSIDQTPEGLFIIQDEATGKYVSIIVDGILSASVGADVLAAKFRLKFKAGGSSIFSIGANLYVTGLTEAGGPLKAIANAALSNEIFRWTKDGDLYKLQAMVNRNGVHTDADGHLVNTAGSSSSYKLIPVEETEPAPVPSKGHLKNLQNNNYVTSTNEDPVLRAIIADAGSAPTWSFEPVAESPENAKLYAIRNDATNKVISGNPDSSSPLFANGENASGWEYFQIVKYQNGWIIIHAVTGRPISLQSDSTLLDNGSDISNSALWSIE